MSTVRGLKVIKNNVNKKTEYKSEFWVNVWRQPEMDCDGSLPVPGGAKLTGVSQCQKGKTNLDFTEARNSEWQWHYLGHMQVCTSLQTDTTPAPHHSVFYRPDALPAAQPTASKHWRRSIKSAEIMYVRGLATAVSSCTKLKHNRQPGYLIYLTIW